MNTATQTDPELFPEKTFLRGEATGLCETSLKLICNKMGAIYFASERDTSNARQLFLDAYAVYAEDLRIIEESHRAQGW